MKSESSEIDEPTIPQKKSPAGRGNFSKCGKLCDQTFYLESEHVDIHKKVQFQVRKKSPTRQSTTAFTSIGRQKRGNFRFDIQLRQGEFSHHPDFFYGNNKSPKWSFPKKERYNNIKIEEYEICSKHPIAKKQNQRMMYNSVSSIKQTMKTNLKLTKSGSLNETMDETRNYSIVLPRQTSPVGFFTKTKIKNPFYLTKQEIMNQEQQLQPSKDIEPCPKGYIQFYKKRARKQNPVVKGFQIYLPNYQHQKQFNNFSMTQHPTKPQHHIDFSKHLRRNSDARNTYGPNLQRINIDPVRKNKSNIDLNTKKFRNKIRTKFDRVGPEPNTRLDYGPFEKELGGMIEIDRMLGREQRLRSKRQSLQPIVDPAIKKAGDAEMKQTLKKFIKTKQINEALRPKCAEPVQI